MSNFKLNKSGVKELMMSENMANVLQEHANRIKLGAGDGYITKRIRTRVLVGAESERAKDDNYRNNTLLKQSRKGHKK